MLIPAPPPAAWPGVLGPPGKPRSIGVSILLAVVTLGIYSFFWVYFTHDELKRHSGNGLGGGIGLLVYVLVSPVTFFLIPNEVRSLYEDIARQPSRVSVTTGLWVLLPIAGVIVWFVKVQGALNRYWRGIAATG